MKKYLLQIIVLAVISATIYSCKLDPPILPGQPGYIKVIPPGGGDTTGTGTPINNSALTGTWKVNETLSIIYSDGKIANTAPSIIKLFTDVQIADSLKRAVFDGQFALPNDTTSYAATNSAGKLYLQLSADPFERSGNAPIQVTSLTATTMTWIALDPLVVTSAGHKVQTAWEVTFTKE